MQVHDIVETDDGDWIVMELVEGRSLQEVIDDGGFEMSRVVELAKPWYGFDSAAIVAAMERAVGDYAGNVPYGDDVTILAVNRKSS